MADIKVFEISAQKAYLTQAAACHIYLGIFGTQYGYEDAEGISPTEREYDTATEHFAHRLIYTLRTEYGLRSPEFIQAEDLTSSSSFAPR